MKKIKLFFALFAMLALWFCMYATSTGKALNLYKKVEDGSTEPVVSLLPKFIYFWCSLFSG